jgi:ketosteroid isomerase-like protein
MTENVLGPLIEDISNFRYARGIPRVRRHGRGDRSQHTGSGRPAASRVVHVRDVHDGKIARFRQFADTAKFREVVAAEGATTR